MVKLQNTTHLGTIKTRDGYLETYTCNILEFTFILMKENECSDYTEIGKLQWMQKNYLEKYIWHISYFMFSVKKKKNSSCMILRT